MLYRNFLIDLKRSRKFWDNGGNVKVNKRYWTLRMDKSCSATIFTDKCIRQAISRQDRYSSSDSKIGRELLDEWVEPLICPCFHHINTQPESLILKSFIYGIYCLAEGWGSITAKAPVYSECKWSIVMFKCVILIKLTPPLLTGLNVSQLDTEF